MSYSRRQLEAFGEPLGDSITRKEGGRIIYGGGGSSAPSTQTTVSELPDWAKPYAQETLEKGKALTASPYQAYGGDRIAGFSPLQQQAQTAAAQMRPSELGQVGGQLAGAATMGALGTRYDPFRMGQFTAGRAAQYMNPFVEMAMEPQLREAQRTSEMQRAADQAQATRAGAFGGSRQAIVEAERQRNLGTQLGDIRARGYMSAFDQAQQQFAREQQLREQSRQYGAGLGLQGLQTAIQGAGQLGALGGQEFAQGMDINKLQQQVGAQQQQLQQQGLTQAYQDFLNQQNYPYKQLGFMSDLIRGMPLGQQSTTQMYQAPGSLAGQIAGIGMGAYGLSRAFGGFAEGGEVDEYADGGVTSDENVESILDGLSDIQLEQAKVAALNRGDRIRVAMIDAELAQRASLRSGLGGAFDSLPPESQESVFAAANGGMVAFADGGLGIGAEFGGEPVVSDVAAPSARSAAEVDRIVEAMRARGKTIGLSDVQDIMAGRGDYSSLLAPPVKQARAEAPAARADTPPAPTAKPPRAGFSKQEAAAAVNTVVQGTGVQVPEDKTQEIANTLYNQMMARSKADRDSFRAELETAKGRAKEIEARGIGEALAKFGFGMAAAAAKPGRRQGLAGVIESAATASPLLAESMAETQKLKAAAQDNYMKMRMENARYESAVEQGNMQLAATLANNISQRKLAQATLQEQIAQNERMFGLKKEELGIMRARSDKQTPIQEIANDLMQADPNLDRKSALLEASRIAGYSFRSEQAGDLKRLELLEKVRKANPMYGALETKLTLAKTPQEKTQILQQLAEMEERAVGKVLSGSGVGSGAGQVYRFDAKGNPIQ